MKSKLGRKISLIITGYALFLLLVSSLLTGIFYYSTEFKAIIRDAYNYVKNMSELIDGDRVAAYVETNQTDEHYEQILNYLNHTRVNSELLYYYVFLPCEDDILYIWDADSDTESGYTLGQHEPYFSDEQDQINKIMQKTGEEYVLVTQDDEYGMVASVYYPVQNSRGESVAIVGADLSVGTILKNLFRVESMLVLSLLAAIILTMVLLRFAFHRGIVVPIKELRNAAQRMVTHLETEDELKISINTQDEIQDLSDSFSEMFREVKDYIARLSEVTSENERISTELNVARNIQRSALPTDFPKHEQFELFASMTPAKEVGGDFYDFYMLDEDHLVLTIADVSGKGVPAALFMMTSKTLLKNQSAFTASPAKVFELVNNRLCENNEADMFVTAWLGIVEISTGKVVAANAGHEFPAIRRADGTFELFKDKHGLVLAGMENSRYREYEFEIEKGGTLFVYTDGVPEAADDEFTLFGTERMIEALNRKPQADPDELLANVQESLDAFVKNAPQFDDLTMLAYKRL